MCVGCGLCLPHCPTFRVTGEEGLSPRGRIALIKESVENTDRSTKEVRTFLDSCVQCRGCEPACPSGVRYGRILAAVNQRDEEAGRRPTPALRVFLALLEHPRMFSVIGRMGLVVSTSKLRSFVPRRMRIAGVSRRQGPRLRLRHESPDTWLFTGCVMDTWFRSVHRATSALIGATGRSVATPTPSGSCCGALHMHAGDETGARRLAERVMATMPGTAPIIVDSAGCGAMLEEYGDLLGTPEARAFSQRVIDINEWVLDNLAELDRVRRNNARMEEIRPPVIVQEPCHLRHVQRVDLANVLEHFVPVVRLDDDGLCCGAGGAYSFLQPDLADGIRSRKAAAIRRAAGGAGSTVVTANPGCHLHLAGAGFELRSSVEVLTEVLGLDTPGKG